MDEEKIRFIEEKRPLKTLHKPVPPGTTETREPVLNSTTEQHKPVLPGTSTHDTKNSIPPELKGVTNPIRVGLLKFSSSKQKFNLKDI